MFTSTLKGWKSKLVNAVRVAPVRESSHGFDAGENLYQPQDAAMHEVHDEGHGGLRIHSKSAGACESEDARLTGGTRSLMRRVSGLNVAVIRPKRVVASLPARAA